MSEITSKTQKEVEDIAQRALIEKYKAVAVEKFNAMVDAEFQYRGFSRVYKDRQRNYLRNRFTAKFGRSGWLKIDSVAHPKLNGYYEFSEDDGLVGEQYEYPESLASLEQWVRLKKLSLTAAGFKAAYPEVVLFSGDFLEGSSASPCQKPEFKVRPQKKQKAK